jgi:hypothetical protein
MKKLNIQPTFLQIVYLILFFILFSVVIYTPTLISGSVHLTKKLILEEESIEGTLLGILFIVSILILNLYKREVFLHKEQIEKINTDKKKVEERLNESDQYIGIVNVQIQEIKSIFNSIDQYPETKADLKKSFIFFGKKVLGIVNSDWVLIRIINSETLRTISEHFETRRGFPFDYPQISNKMIVEKQPILSYTSVSSNPKNLNILVFCIMPVDKISKDQRVFIQAIINEISKMFVILNSSYYKNDDKIFAEDYLDKNEVTLGSAE